MSKRITENTVTHLAIIDVVCFEDACAGLTVEDETTRSCRISDGNELFFKTHTTISFSGGCLSSSGYHNTLTFSKTATLPVPDEYIDLQAEGSKVANRVAELDALLLRARTKRDSLWSLKDELLVELDRTALTNDDEGNAILTDLTSHLDTFLED